MECFLVTTEKWGKGGAKILSSYLKSLELEQEKKVLEGSVCLFCVCTGVDLRATSLHQIGSGCRIAAQMGQHYVGDSSETSHFTYASY